MTDRRNKLCREEAARLVEESDSKMWRLNFATDIAGRCRALYNVRWYVSRFTLQNILLFFRFRFAVAPFELARDLRRFLITAYSIRSLREASVSRVFFLLFLLSNRTLHRSPLPRFVFAYSPPPIQSAVTAAVGSRVTTSLIFLIGEPDFLNGDIEK